MADAFCENLVDYGNVKIFTNDEIGAVMIVLGACYFFMNIFFMTESQINEFLERLFIRHLEKYRMVTFRDTNM
jgi:hypothetical protein